MRSDRDVRKPARSVYALDGLTHDAARRAGGALATIRAANVTVGIDIPPQHKESVWP